MGKNRNAGRKGRNKKSAQVYLPFATKGKDQNLEKGSTVQGMQILPANPSSLHRMTDN